ncbi:MAG: hypothetical protein H6988_13010 [Pseudomonadales bacterium]|nr:hypothetical protein [Pseudomonadales bacterium]MCP5191288.1 hypothetical protein [Pseudomonadales bacterium]
MSNDTADLQVLRIVAMLDELRESRSPLYARGLDFLIDAVPESPDREKLRQHRQAYLDSLEAGQ